MLNRSKELTQCLDEGEIHCKHCPGLLHLSGIPHPGMAYCLQCGQRYFTHGFPKLDEEEVAFVRRLAMKFGVEGRDPRIRFSHMGEGEHVKKAAILFAKLDGKMLCEGCGGDGDKRVVPVLGQGVATKPRTIQCDDCNGEGFVKFSTIPYCR